jgi:hypothetical protein
MVMAATAALMVPTALATATMAGTAGAGTPSATSVSVAAGGGVSASQLAVPNSNISKSKKTGKLAFSPSKLATGWSGPFSNPPPACTTSNDKATITNKSKKGATLTYNGVVIGTLPAKSYDIVCFWGSGPHVFKYGLKGSKSKLAISVS